MRLEDKIKKASVLLAKVGDAVNRKTITDALTFVNRITFSSRGGQNINAASEKWLQRTVTKDLKLYRGIGLVLSKVPRDKIKEYNNLKVGETIPVSLVRQVNTISSYTKKKGLAMHYSSGKLSLVVEAKVPVKNVIADLEKLRELINKDFPSQDIISDSDFDYFKTDKEVLVREPVQAVVIKKSGRL